MDDATSKKVGKPNYKKWIIIIINIVVIAFLILVVFANGIFGDPNNPFVSAFSGEDTSGGLEALGNAITSNLPRIIKTITFMIITIYVSKLIRYLLKRSLEKGNRVTFSKLAVSIVKYGTAIILICQVLSCFGVDVNTLVGGAGILALIVGLGAQKLISDVISGMFFLFEGEFKVGDIVVIDGWRGTVQSIGIRSTQVMDAGGNIKIISNSSINNIINNTSALSLAICDVGIEYGESIERVEKVIMDNLPIIKEKIPAIVVGPFYKGVNQLGDSCVVIRIVAQCKEEDKYQIQRDLNREIKIIFDNNDINIPFPQIVLNQPPEFVHVTKATKKVADAFVAEQKEKSKNMEEQNNDS